MSSYLFPGYPSFLRSAAEELGLPEAASHASRIVPLTALANLCAQASQCDPSHVGGIVMKAAEFRDQLAVALRAAELMLADVEDGRGPSAIEDREGRPASTTSAASPDPRKARKGTTTSRETS